MEWEREEGGYITRVILQSGKQEKLKRGSGKLLIFNVVPDGVLYL